LIEVNAEYEQLLIFSFCQTNFWPELVSFRLLFSGYFVYLRGGLLD